VTSPLRNGDLRAGFARLAVGAVFAMNVHSAVAFLAYPRRYAPGFELAGVAGEAAVRGLGVAFLMWNATYPLVIWHPRRHRVLFGIVLAQQAIGLLGESWIRATLPTGHATLAAGIERFILFDAVGLLVMLAAFAALGGDTGRAGQKPRRLGSCSG
jgi:hypothetical protein